MYSTIFGRFTTMERAEIYVDALNEYANNVIGACRVFSEVARKMDGKCYNVRFWRALDEALLERFGTITTRDGVELQRVRIVITDGFGGDLFFSVKVKNSDAFIDGHAYDVQGDIYASIFIDYNLAFEGNQRIKADEFERAARKIAVSAEIEQTKWLDAIRFWDAYMDRCAEIDELMKKLAPKINPLFIRLDVRELLNGKNVRLMGKKFE